MKAEYVVKPRNVFKHPFNKFDLDKSGSRETQNQDITDYFNYGFNQDTMNVYAKLVKRTIEVLDQNVIAETLNQQPNLLRLNDQIPMDFGGFCKFFDPSVFTSKNQKQEDDEENQQESIDEGEKLFSYLIYRVTKMRNQQYPLIDFVKSLYRDEQGEHNQIEMCNFMDQVQENLQRKYQETMVKLAKKQEAKNPPPKHEHKVKHSKERSKREPSSDSDSDDSSDQSQSQQRSRHKKRHRRSREKSSRKNTSSDKRSKSKRQKSKEKSRKEKSRNRERSRDKDKDKKKRRHDSRQKKSRHKRKDRR